MNRTQANSFLKVCGITTSEDLGVCLELGVHFVGFNFWKGSKRHITPQKAKDLWEDQGVKFGSSNQPVTNAVAVVCAPSQDDVSEMIKTCPFLHAVQFHGKETYDKFRAYQVPIHKWYAQHVGGSADIQAGIRFASESELVLFDRKGDDGTLGGTGKAFDWSWLKDIPQNRFGVAGGVTVDNVDDLFTYSPRLIDVCSGTEKTPGVKDHAKIEAIWRKVKR